jgi:RNA-directed DNA polymerase
MNTELEASPEELIAKFYGLSDLADVSDLLEVEHDTLNTYLQLPEKKKYFTYGVPKKGGGFREIAAPASNLKLIQKKLNQILQYVFEKEVR